MTTKPVLIFIPGAWHTPEFFSEVFSKLEPLGYKCIGYSLFAVGHEPAVKDLQPDIDAVHKLVSDESDAGNDVVIVAHSWGGIMVSGALDGLSKIERQKEGKKGGVVRIAYMTSFVLTEGVSLIAAFGGQPEWYDVKVCHGFPNFPVALTWLTRMKGTLGYAKNPNPNILP
jgi:pimeloyl-ACP methyl ester carboxylesterase